MPSLEPPPVKLSEEFHYKPCFMRLQLCALLPKLMFANISFFQVG